MNDRRATPDIAPGWQYAGRAIFLHWLLAALIALQVGVGWYMVWIEDRPESEWFFSLHKSVGIVVFFLVLWRLAWRMRHRPAPLPSSMPRWQVKLALATHWLLYAGMIALPITGFLGASLSKSGVVLFGLRLPAWVTPDHDLSELILTVHVSIAWTVVALVVLHTAGALKHLLLDRDRVFQRMLP